MHIIRPHQASITLFSRHGSVDVFPSAKQALKKLGYAWIVANVGPHFRTFNGNIHACKTVIDTRSCLRDIISPLILCLTTNGLRFTQYEKGNPDFLDDDTSMASYCCHGA